MAERASRNSRTTRPVEPAPRAADAVRTEAVTAPGEAERVDAEVTDTRTGPALDGTPGSDGPADPGGGIPMAESSSRGAAAQGTPGSPTAGAGDTDGNWSPRPRGLDPDEVRSRWNEAQGGFVDDPRQAVSEADALASDVAEAVVAEIESRRSALRSAWSEGGTGDTETLRVSLRDYRAFVQRLMSENAR